MVNGYVQIHSYLCCGAHLAVGAGITWVTGAHTTQTAAVSRAKLQTGLRDTYVAQYHVPQLTLGGVKNCITCVHRRWTHFLLQRILPALLDWPAFTNFSREPFITSAITITATYSIPYVERETQYWFCCQIATCVTPKVLDDHAT